MSITVNDLNRVDLVYCHAPCPDGKYCEYLMRQLRPDLKEDAFRPYEHGKTKITPEEIKDKCVLFADFGPPDNINELSLSAREIFDVDHHPLHLKMSLPTNVKLMWSDSKEGCGASLLWSIIHPLVSIIPFSLQLVQAVDTGNFDSLTEDEKKLHMALTEDVRNIDAYGSRIRSCDMDRKSLMARGEELHRYHTEITNRAWTLRKVTEWTVCDQRIRVCNVVIDSPLQIRMHYDKFVIDAEVDVLACWKTTGMGVSLRAKKHINLNHLARLLVHSKKVLSGGGHELAAALQFSSKTETLPNLEQRNHSIVTWNVNHLDGDKWKFIIQYFSTSRPAFLCLTETKQSEAELSRYASALSSFYTPHYNAHVPSQHHGMMVLVRNDVKAERMIIPMNCPMREDGDKRLDASTGRVIVLLVERSYYLVATYVPNAGRKLPGLGQTLKHLDYRLNVWNPAMSRLLESLRACGPTLWIGDLNVAPQLDVDCMYPRRMASWAGCTEGERKHFNDLLKDGKWVDVIRHHRPKGEKVWTYRGKSGNLGMRLDHAIASDNLLSCVKSSFVSPSNFPGPSDHVPCGVEIVYWV